MLQDKWSKLLLLWIAVMLTVIALKPMFNTPVAYAEDRSSLEPVEVTIKSPIEVKIVDFKSTWPCDVKIKDDVEIKGELKMKN